MKFHECANALRQGKKIKIDCWSDAYWYLDDNGKVMNHYENSDEEVPVFDMDPFKLILFSISDDWEIIDGDEPKQKKKGERCKEYFDFGKAISYLKDGKKVARKGWNGKGMFLVLCHGNEVPTDRMRVKAVKDFYEVNGKSVVTINPHIDMKAADGSYVTGWLASQADMLAEDWHIVE
jgi:hypothetical protein